MKNKNNNNKEQKKRRKRKKETKIFFWLLTHFAWSHICHEKWPKLTQLMHRFALDKKCRIWHKKKTNISQPLKNVIKNIYSVLNVIHTCQEHANIKAFTIIGYLNAFMLNPREHPLGLQWLLGLGVIPNCRSYDRQHAHSLKTRLVF